MAASGGEQAALLRQLLDACHENDVPAVASMHARGPALLRECVHPALPPAHAPNPQSARRSLTRRARARPARST